MVCVILKNGCTEAHRNSAGRDSRTQVFDQGATGPSEFARCGPMPVEPPNSMQHPGALRNAL